MCKMIKKILILLLCCVMLFSFAACDKKDEAVDDVATSTDATSTTEVYEEIATKEDASKANIDFDISADINSINMKVGDVQKVNITVEPNDVEYDIIWSVDKVAIVAISDGEIKAIASGECQVTAKIKGTEKAVNIKVTVEADEVETEEADKDSDDKKKEDSNSSKDDGSDSSGNSSNNDSGNNSNTGSNSNTGNDSNTGSNSNTGNDSNAESNSNTGNNSNSGNNSNTGNNSNSGSNSNTSNNTTTTTEATTEATTTEIQEEGYHIDYAASVLALVNEERAKVGVAPLTLDYSLMAAANVRSKECAESFSHTRPNGTSCFSVLDELGIGYGACGENIAAGYWSAESVVAGWVSSPGHYSNMISASYTRMAVSCYYDPNSDYGCYWAQLFIN